MGIEEIGLVDGRGVVCRKRVGDEKTKSGLYDEDLRVGA